MRSILRRQSLGYWASIAAFCWNWGEVVRFPWAFCYRIERLLVEVRPLESHSLRWWLGICCFNTTKIVLQGFWCSFSVPWLISKDGFLVVFVANKLGSSIGFCRCQLWFARVAKFSWIVSDKKRWVFCGGKLFLTQLSSLACWLPWAMKFGILGAFVVVWTRSLQAFLA